MRDDRDFNSVVTLVRKHVPKVGSGPTYTYTGTRKSIRSFRSYATPTTPSPSGNYYQTTDYVAFFATTSAIAGSCTYRRSSTLDYEETWDAGQSYTSAKTWNYGCAGDHTPDIPDALVSAARSHAISKLRNNQDFNAGQFLGEMKETVKTANSLVQDILHFTKLFKVKHGAGAIAREYLRYIFGIKPFVNDLYSIAELVRTGLGEPLGHIKTVLMDTGYSLPLPPNSRYFYTGTVKRGVEVAYYIRVTNPTLYDLQRYGLTNPLSLVWELTSLSFVLDWFTGFGNFISALDANLGISVAAGYQTDFLENRFTQWYDLRQSTKYGIKKGFPWSELPISTKSMKRWDLPLIIPPVPFFDMGLNLNQLTSGIALLVAQLR